MSGSQFWDGPNHAQSVETLRFPNEQCFQTVESSIRKRFPTGLLPSNLLPTLLRLGKTMSQMETFRKEQWTRQQRTIPIQFNVKVYIPCITGMCLKTLVHDRGLISACR